MSPAKARCRFVQYMANKPDKFGIKFWLAADRKSKYLLNRCPYLGKDERTKFYVEVLNKMMNNILQSQLEEGNHFRFSPTY